MVVINVQFSMNNFQFSSCPALKIASAFLIMKVSGVRLCYNVTSVISRFIIK